MSQDYSTIKNKQQKQSKVFFEQYLYNSSEPRDDDSSDTPPELEAELLENSYDIKRQFRHLAQRLRNRYS
ncbi:MAG TPA: hypothetical protein VIH90_01170 [Candidatus Saccharimonadales bacterium]